MAHCKTGPRRSCTPTSQVESLRHADTGKPAEAPPQNSTSLADTDRDGVPDTADPMPYDFNNDGTPDAQTNCDVDGDGIIDYGCPGGTDYWLNTTIPSTFPAPYAGRS